MSIQPAVKKGTVSYAIYFYALVTVGSVLTIAFSVQAGYYLSSVHALGLLFIIFAIGATVLRSNYLNTDVRQRVDFENTDGPVPITDLPFSAGFWELIYSRYVDSPQFKRVEMAMYVIGALALGVVQAAVKLF